MVQKFLSYLHRRF